MAYQSDIITTIYWRYHQLELQKCIKKREIRCVHVMLTHPRELWFECGLFLHFPPLAVCPQSLPHPPDDGLPHPTTGNSSLLATHRATSCLYSLLPAHTHTNKVLVGHGLEVPSSVRENGSAVSFIFDGKASLAQSCNPTTSPTASMCVILFLL